jgi:hypothetical protein
VWAILVAVWVHSAIHAALATKAGSGSMGAEVTSLFALPVAPFIPPRTLRERIERDLATIERAAVATEDEIAAAVDTIRNSEEFVAEDGLYKPLQRRMILRSQIAMLREILLCKLP